MATAVLKEQNKVAFVACGLIPGCETFLEIIGKEPYTLIKRQNEGQVQKTLKFLTSVDKADKHVQKFLSLYPAWVEEREKCIREILGLAYNIDFHHRNINIAQLPTCAIGIVGGVMTITGLALIPVTFGASLGLTIAGAIVGGGATVAGVANAGTDIGVRIHRTTKAKKCVDEHKKATQAMETTVNKLLCLSDDAAELATDDALALAEGISVRNVAEVPRYVAVGLKNAVSIVNIVIRTIPKAAKSLHLLRKGFGITAAASASSMRTVDVAADVVAGAVKVVASTAFNVLGFMFSAIGVAADLFTAGVAIYNLAKGSKTSSAKALRKVASELTEEMENVTKMMEVLNGS